MRLYVAGPMTGLPELNYPEFIRVQKELEEAGFETLSPHVNKLDPLSEVPAWNQFMRAGFQQLVQCDGVALLDGWVDSKGANLEVTMAQAMGMRTRNWYMWLNA